MKRKLPAHALYGAVAGALLVYALFGWFMLVSPKRAEAAKLKDEVATTEVAVAAARSAATRSADAQPITVADIFRVAKAMPSEPDMPGIFLELARLAEESGIEFQSITPGVRRRPRDFQRIPITLAFDGNFYELSDFLFRLRTLVGVRSSELYATGRLFSVATLGFEESPRGFPDLQANLTVDAFVYGTSEPANTAPPAATTPPDGQRRDAGSARDRGCGRPRRDPLDGKEEDQPCASEGREAEEDGDRARRALPRRRCDPGAANAEDAQGPCPCRWPPRRRPPRRPRSPTPPRRRVPRRPRPFRLPARPRPPGQPAVLASSDLPAAGAGQLLSFERFQSKDPFTQQVDPAAAPEPPAPPAPHSRNRQRPHPPRPPPSSGAAGGRSRSGRGRARDAV